MKHLQDSVIRTRALKAYDAAEYGEALHLGETIIKRHRRDGLLHLAIGASARALGDLATAAEYLRAAVTLLPREPLALVEFARLKFAAGEFDEALAVLDRALRVEPQCRSAVAVKAGVLEHRGDYDAAAQVLEPYVRAGTEDETMAVVLARVLLHAAEFTSVIELATRHLTDPRLGVLNRMHLAETLAKAHERLGQYDEAFDVYRASNQAQALHFDPEEHTRAINELITTFSATNLARLPRAINRSPAPVFIASMPRSGSTLVEQIIHAHPQAFGAGELTHITKLVTNLPMTLDSYRPYPSCIFDLRTEDADRLATEYLERQQKLAGRAQRVANKALDNYLHLGIIHLLFPGARIIHVQRDPMDNCFSCYTASLRLPWSTDLKHIAAAFLQCERLMSHWKEVLDLPILEVRYEDLVAKPEAGIRTIIDFLHLPWDDRCLRYWEARRPVMTLSYDQVTQPIYASSIGRWRRYESHLAPLREALGDAAEAR